MLELASSRIETQAPGKIDQKNKDRIFTVRSRQSRQKMEKSSTK